MTKLKGFTLIELMVAMGLISSLSVVILSLSISGTQNFASVQNINYENTVFNAAFNRIDRHVRTALEFPASVTDPNTFTTYATTDPVPTLIMKLASLKSDGSVCPDKYDYVIYRIENTKLYEILLADSASSRKSTNQIIMEYVKDTSSFTQDINAAVHRVVTATLVYEKTESAKITTRTRTQVMVARND